MYEIEKTLCKPNTIKGFGKNGAPIYIISKQRLKTGFFRLRNRLSSLDSGTSTIEVVTEYASHLYDMYIKQHDGKHMTGDRMKILILNLPFLMQVIAGSTSSRGKMYGYHALYRAQHRILYSTRYSVDVDIGTISSTILGTFTFD